jgi:nuclear pore complex protein Nup50
MKGMKRFGLPDSNSLSANFDMPSKRVMLGSPFDFQRAEPSQQPTLESSPLDNRRAESSRQHVRALNTQFASWVQTQLQNHPDEIWEDGVQDYLTHSSSIMEKFSDVVNWLKANAAKSENFSTLVSNVATQKKLVSETKDKEINSFPKFGSSTVSTTTTTTSTGFSAAWTPGTLFNNQAPLSFGIQTSGAQSPNLFKLDTSNDADAEDEVERPSSPSVKKSEEKGVIVVHEVKCKLYIKSSDPTDKDAWKDRGTGQLSIKCKEGVSKGTKDSKPTILVRNDVGKVVLNALLYKGIKTTVQKNSVVAIFHTAGDGGAEENSSKPVARTFLIRTKSVDDRNKLESAIQEYAPQD